MVDLNKLPEIAYKDNPKDGQFSTDAPVIAFKRGEKGYYPVMTPATAAELNANKGTTLAQVEAMHMGSLFGWDVPGANPDNYNEDGSLKKSEELDRGDGPEPFDIEYGANTLTIGDLKKRLAYLADRHKYGQPEEDASREAWDEWKELEMLQDVEHELSWCWSDDNKTLISTDHFTDFIREELYELGDIKRGGVVDSWSGLDWDKITEAVEQDYRMFDLDEYTYWTRN